jgi:hypothetical protein
MSPPTRDAALDRLDDALAALPAGRRTAVASEIAVAARAAARSEPAAFYPAG